MSSQSVHHRVCDLVAERDNGRIVKRKDQRGKTVVCQSVFYFGAGYDAHTVIRKTAGTNGTPEAAQAVDLGAAQFHSGEKEKTSVPE